jgi:site-specific DNA-methyltransferase (adenine-specific)
MRSVRVKVERIGDATLYLGDCAELLAEWSGGGWPYSRDLPGNPADAQGCGHLAGDKPAPMFDAVITDPPYGTADLWKKPNVPKARKWHLFGEGEILDWDQPQEIVPSFAALAPKVIVWGGNFYPLPTSRSWLVWNKIIRNFSTSVCELAWTNLDKPIDAFDYSHGQLANEGKHHPTQKPLPLMVWCLEKAGKPRVTLDPFMGSGTTGVACATLGLSFIGIEREPKYFDIACKRIADAYKQPALIPHESPQMKQEELL